MNYNEIKAFIKASRETATDETALTGIALYPHWKAGEAVALGDRKQHNGILYKCIQAHTTQADWQPDATPALWAVVSLEEWPEWKQPAGAHDAYNKGDKVKHNSKKWVSTADANVWEPGVYGWDEYVQP